MSEYQRYDFMTCDQPLTRAQVNEVNNLSSHIEVSPTRAFVEYSWGDFKSNPINVLHKYFDAFLYRANWGDIQLAFRFPHGILPSDLLHDYDIEDFMQFTQHQDYDILDIDFSESEGNGGSWLESDSELGSLIPIREEILSGDLRALYIVWLASKSGWSGGYFEDEEEYDEEEEEEWEEEEDESSIPPVPPGLGKLTAAQHVLAELLRVPSELLAVAARHSRAMVTPSINEDVTRWINLLSPERQHDYLVRLVRNEPGLSRLLVKELRELAPNKADKTSLEGERVSYNTLQAEYKVIKEQLERERREQAERARLQHIQEVHNHQDRYWGQVNELVKQAAGARYDEAVGILVDLRNAATYYKETQQFQERFSAWVQLYQRRPALIQRLQKTGFTLPKG